MRVLARLMSGADGEDPAAIERELARLREQIEKQVAEATRLGGEWLFADSRDGAEQIDRRRQEALRLAERDRARVLELETRLAAAQAEAQRQALARHRQIMQGLFPRLRAAVAAAAQVQMEAINARNAAIAQLGEGIVSQHLPPVAFLGLLLPDLINLWSAEQEKLWAPPAAKPQPAPSKPPAAPAKAAVNGHAPAPQPAQRPKPARRAARQDPAPRDGEIRVVFMKSGAELPDGTMALAGDEINIRSSEDARILVLRGVADYASRAGQ